MHPLAPSLRLPGALVLACTLAACGGDTGASATAPAATGTASAKSESAGADTTATAAAATAASGDKPEVRYAP